MVFSIQLKRFCIFFCFSDNLFRKQSITDMSDNDFHSGPEYVKKEIEFTRPESAPKFIHEFNFDTIVSKPPVTVAQTAKPVEKIEFKLKYLNTVPGVLRVLLIVSFFKIME